MKTMPNGRCAPVLAAAAATASLTTPLGEPLAARIGIATGLVVVGDLVGEGSAQEEAVVGETPNLAARLQALAEPNTVVIADGTQRLVAGLFDMIDLGHQRAQGLRNARSAPGASPARPMPRAALMRCMALRRRWWGDPRNSSFCFSAGSRLGRERARRCCCRANRASASRG